MESDLKKELKKIFPLKIISEVTYLGMGESGIRYKLTTNNGDQICYSDYKPLEISNINLLVNQAINEMQ
jgi:hypothetical protein